MGDFIFIDGHERYARASRGAIDQIINYDGSTPKEIILEDKTELEQIRLIQQLEEEDKQTIFRLVEKMLTNKKFKDFFAKNAAAL
ncbi:hypothetical protein SAMN05421639_102805 [Chryseobacterium shigense]|uniref:Transcriptional regulator n=1 Tax=Chryseobacterium shigense TaxID=297244 RepID=A0A1N7IA64_9FLAO|nr:XRE family transcriptional regulator [Chryseobacterium shigense]SIS33964.1 hypothetical protein SAMN05421639_102805 [Chryseobacterium shigense]